jgi:putative ABC transport system permease protein
MRDWSREVLGRLAESNLPPAREAEIVEEVAQHIEDRYQELVAGGATEEEARRAALEELSDQSAAGLARELRRVEQPVTVEPSVLGVGGRNNIMADLWQDIRYSLRMLRRSPGFTAVAVITLALGIGANTAIFSVVNAVLLRPLPFTHAEQLVQVFQTLPQESIPEAGASYPNYIDWSRQCRAFEEIAATRRSAFTLTGNGEPTYVDTATVTSSLFPLLGVKPIRGRTLLPDDEKPGSDRVVLMSEGLWRQRFGSEPSLVGKTIVLDKQAFVVVGVMPGDFRFPYPSPPVQLWIPLSQDPVFKDLFQGRAGHYLETIVGRLKPGVSLAQGQAQLETVMKRLAQEYPDANRGWSVRLVPLHRQLAGNARTGLLILLGAVGLVLLIACANVATLLLARAVKRVKEISVGTALGASRMRIASQLLTESILLSLLGGAGGLLIAYWPNQVLVRFLPSDFPQLHEIRVDVHVLVFAFVLSIVAGIVFGLAPAFQSSKSGLQESLKEGSSGSGEGRRRKNLRSAFVVSEVALATLLLIAAGLLLRSFERLQKVDLGFNPEHLLGAGVSLPKSQYTKPDQWISLFDQLIDRLKAQPGVLGAAVALPLPPSGSGFGFGFAIDGRPAREPGQGFSADYSAVSSEYFRVMQISLLRGRLFTGEDTSTSPKVCIISDALARHYFPQEDPLGKRLIFGYQARVPREIVGVVRDVRQTSLTEPGGPVMYVPYAQDPWWAMAVVLRGVGSPAALATGLRAQVHTLDKDLPIADVQPLTQAIYESSAQPRFRTLLLGLFGLMALVLAAAGIYGVISYDVSQRSREIGVRMALGAQRGDLLKQILKEGMALTAVGLGAGLAGAWFASRVLASLLFEVNAQDLATFAGSAILLAGVALFACFVPARRATKVDPMVALRYE